MNIEEARMVLWLKSKPRPLRVRRTRFNGMSLLDGSDPLRRILLSVWCDALARVNALREWWSKKG
jgi:hypothetical protein